MEFILALSVIFRIMLTSYGVIIFYGSLATFGNNTAQLMAKSIGLRDARDRLGKYKEDSYYIIVNNVLFSKLATDNGLLGGTMIFLRICQLLSIFSILFVRGEIWIGLFFLIIIISSILYHVINTLLIYLYTKRFYKEKAVLYALFNFFLFSIPGAYIIGSLSERVTEDKLE